MKTAASCLALAAVLSGLPVSLNAAEPAAEKPAVEKAATDQSTAEKPAAVAGDDSGKITEADKKLFQDVVAGRKAKAAHTAAVMKARLLGLGLFEFETEYGSFPDETTIGSVKANAAAGTVVKADSANDCFYQLVAPGFILNADTFDSGKPFDPLAVGSADKIPARVEKCDFSYLAGMDAGGYASRPLVVAPLLKGTRLFDPVPFGGNAVILFVDNSVRSFPIGEDGKVSINGMDIFDPAQPFWKDSKVPEVKWPEK